MAAFAQACRFNLMDSAIALNIAFFVNAAILIVAAATFGRSGQPVDQIQDAHRLLHELLGTQVAPIAFALALICAGQSSTITGTLAGQITMEGFLHFRIRPWLRRLITRLLAIIPAVLVIGLAGAKDTSRLLVFSQVVLSLQLPFAVVPLVKFTSSRMKMGRFATRWWLAILAWGVAAIIIALNGKLMIDQLAEWHRTMTHGAWIITFIVAPIAIALGVLLFWLIIRPEQEAVPSPQTLHAAPPAATKVLAAADLQKRQFHRIGVALEASLDDAAMLGEAIAMARAIARNWCSCMWSKEQAGNITAPKRVMPRPVTTTNTSPHWPSTCETNLPPTASRQCAPSLDLATSKVN